MTEPAPAVAPLLDVQDLRVAFDTPAGPIVAVDGVDLAIRAGETLAVVGESGSGKSVMALALLRLVPDPPGRIVGGRILFDGQDLATAPEPVLRDLRGRRIAMIFQEPSTALNPVRTIGDQIAEAIRLHEAVGRTEAARRAVELLRMTGIPAPERRVAAYPFELSGGMRQRAMIAMALACRPALLIADEPTTALDVTVQAQVLELVRALKAATGTAMLLITHDLGVVAETADRVAVMYAGRIVERAAATALFDAPEHPYTLGLLSSMPAMAPVGGRLVPIEGSVPDPFDPPAGCAFHPRCPFAFDRCRTGAPPPLRPLGVDEGPAAHEVACWRAPLLGPCDKAAGP